MASQETLNAEHALRRWKVSDDVATQIAFIIEALHELLAAVKKLEQRSR